MKLSLLKSIDKDMAKELLKATPLLTATSFKLMVGSTKGVTACPTESAWEAERDDILERANWLCKQVIKAPQDLLNSAPAMIGKHFQGEWAIYSCSMLAHAIANISVLYPDKKEKCPALIAQLIDIVNTPELRWYDTHAWKEDAMETLDGKNHHMTYLSILAWMITNYKLIGGDGRYDEILHKLCETLNRRMLESPYDLNLLSFPNQIIWLPDMLVTIVALKNYSRLYDGKFSDTVEAWLNNAKTLWIHKPTGLLAGTLPGASWCHKNMQVLGSHSALICSYLSLVDPEFAHQQYQLMCKVMRREVKVMGSTLCGVKEYLKKNPDHQMVPGSAGLVLKGISVGGTAFALGAATMFEDWEFRYKMLCSAEVTGGTKKQKGMRHYRLGEMFLVGEATALAMRTNINRY